MIWVKKIFGMDTDEINAKKFTYMQLKLYDSGDKAQEAYEEVLKKHSQISVSSFMELRAAKDKTNYPFWLVFYVDCPTNWDRILTDLGDGKFIEGRKLFAKCSNYDDGLGIKKYRAILRKSDLIQSVRLQ